LGLTEAYKKDTFAKKINLGVGAYRDDNGKPYVLPSVREAEQRIVDAKMDHEYAGIGGIKEFVDHSMKFAYGDLPLNRVCGVQTLSGTGAGRIAGEFFARFVKGAQFYMPSPTWANHTPMFKDAGLKLASYRYYNPATCGLDFEGMLQDIQAAPNGSIFLLHACAHNPTGVDPSMEQWAQISKAMKEKSHVVFFDMAYQGFASGDPEKDAGAVRLFVKDGHNITLAQSYAKNFGLYGERVGCLSVVGESEEEMKRIESQLKIIIRPMYSNPPVYGGRIVSTILKDSKLHSQWFTECRGMADRIITMRKSLKECLAKAGSKRNWDHVTNQIGMFCYTGMSGDNVARLKEEFHIYLTKDARISMAGVTSKNVEYLAESIHKVTA